MIIEKRSGTAFNLKKGQVLTVIDREGEQVSDLFCVNENDPKEYFSSGRTIDYLNKIFVSTGDQLYSSKSRPMLEIIEDDVGTHDLLLTPCSHHTFEKLYEDEPPHPGCEGNLINGFKKHNLDFECLPATLNIFMAVRVNGETGGISIDPPLSRAGDKIKFKALQDLIVGLTACSAPKSNNFNCTTIEYQIDG